MTQYIDVFFPSALSSRLALYVYEYLLHVGAQKSAQTFLSEVRSASDVTSWSGRINGIPLSLYAP